MIETIRLNFEHFIHLNPEHFINLLLLFAALGIFGTIIILNRNYRSFPFAISIFISIWIVGEIFHHHVIGSLGFLSNEELAMWIHILAMILFSGIMWIRFYKARRIGKTIPETLESLLK